MLVLASLLDACSSGAATSSSAGTPGASASPLADASTPTPAATPTPVPTPAGMAAPVIVQVENLSDARPQSGLSFADVVYEYATEGGITRFSAIFFTPPPGAVGPVRSARLVSILLTQLWGALLVYSGGSNYTNARLSASHIPRFNESSAGSALYRLGRRRAPHNLYADGGRLASLLSRASLARVAYMLWARQAAAAGGRPVAGFSVPLSATERPGYSWRPDLGGWVRTEAGTGTFIDADTGRPVVAPTVVVVQVPSRINPADVEDVSGARGLEFTLQGSWGAQVFTGGMEFDATLTQPGAGPPQLTLANGAPAPIAPGLVWICLDPQGAPATLR